MDTKEKFTIDGFENLTQQEIFDKAAHHILSTGVRATLPNENCTYGLTGCAAAPFIKPEFRAKVSGEWPPRWNSHGQLCGHGYEVPQHEKTLIRDIQLCHDDADTTKPFLPQFKAKMRNVAHFYNLDTKALNG